MKIEQVWNDAFLIGEYPKDDPDRVTVVRLAEVDQVIAEAVWAMEQLSFYLPQNLDTEGSKTFDRMRAFLESSDLVAQWRKRRKGKV